MGAHVGYEDDAQEQIQPLPVLVLHLLRPLLRHGCAARGSPPPSVCAGNLGSSCVFFFDGILVFFYHDPHVFAWQEAESVSYPYANSFLLGLIIGPGRAASSSSHLVFFGFNWAQAH